jgi:programmed cell death protein 4
VCVCVCVCVCVSLRSHGVQREREMISRLLASLREENVLEPESAADGFLLLLGDNSYLGDLALDTPDAIPALSQFVSRAIVDEVLFPSFLEHPAMAAAPPPQSGEEGAAASPSPGAAVIAGAKQLCSQHHASARISKIWGPGDGRPVAETKRAISLLLGEYLLGLDLDEATRCVRELERPHYLHDVVKQAILAAIDQVSE